MPGALPLPHAAEENQAFAGADFTIGGRRPYPAHQLPGLFRGADGVEIEAEALARIDRYGQWQQDLLCEPPQKIRLPLDQPRDRARLWRAVDEIEQTALGIADAARPAARIAGMTLGEPPARIARGSRKKIRTKRLILLD